LHKICKSERLHIIYNLVKDKKRNYLRGWNMMTKSKSEKERFWNERKTNQQPHEKVKSFKELDKETK